MTITFPTDAKDLPLMNETDTMLMSALNTTTTIADSIAMPSANENASTPSTASSTLSTTIASSMTFATAAPTSPQNRTSSLSPLDMTADQTITLMPSFAAFVATAASAAPSNDTIKPLHSSRGQFESSTSRSSMVSSSSSLGQEEASKSVNRTGSSSNISFSIRLTTMKPCKLAFVAFWNFYGHPAVAAAVTTLWVVKSGHCFTLPSWITQLLCKISILPLD